MNDGRNLSYMEQEKSLLKVSFLATAESVVFWLEKPSRIAASKSKGRLAILVADSDSFRPAHSGCFRPPIPRFSATPGELNTALA